ncbi:MAG: ribonuclease H, partial [Prevotella sp.]|nr:ribonuclease H [Prevotella sp.]
LAIVHALALMQQHGIRKAIYSDSVNAMLWVRKRQCKTKLERNAKTEPLFQIIARAENWLRTHQYDTPIIKWETKEWGEVPADFGRK